MGRCISAIEYWSIYSNGIGGWFAWNATKAKRVDLILVGEYWQACKILESLVRDGKI